jgi:transcriptional regulator with XRE-family HTH domain
MAIRLITQEVSLPPRRQVRTDPEFGRRFRLAMESAGVSPGQLAEEEKVRPQTVSRWRRGELPDDLRMPRLARRFRVSEGWLRSGEGTGGGHPPAGAPGAPVDDLTGDAPEGPGWQFGDPWTWDEEQLRTVLGRIEHTIRAQLVAMDPAGVLRLKVVTLTEMIRSAKEAGRPLPDFFYRILHELESGER